MYQRNSIAWGLLIGAAFPVAGLIVLWIINLIWNRMDPMGMDLPIRERTLLLLVICLNLIPFRMFNQNRKLKSLRGVVTMTVILAFAWIARYFATLMA